MENAIEIKMHALDSSYVMKDKSMKPGKEDAEQDLQKWVKELRVSEEHDRSERKNNQSSNDARQQGNSVKRNVYQTHEERLYLAEMEKCKGNDSFKCGDYQEAADYYTSSLKIFERAIVYNNRALAYLKLKKNKSAEADSTS